jgi:hypothetical protein
MPNNQNAVSPDIRSQFAEAKKRLATAQEKYDDGNAGKFLSHLAMVLVIPGLAAVAVPPLAMMVVIGSGMVGLGGIALSAAVGGICEYASKKIHRKALRNLKAAEEEVSDLRQEIDLSVYSGVTVQRPAPNAQKKPDAPAPA